MSQVCYRGDPPMERSSWPDVTITHPFVFGESLQDDADGFFPALGMRAGRFRRPISDALNQRFCQTLWTVVGEVGNRWRVQFSQDGKVTREHWLSVGQSFAQRQAIAFTAGGHQDTTAGAVELIESGVAHFFEPDRSISFKAQIPQPCLELFGVPTRLAGNNQEWCRFRL